MNQGKLEVVKQEMARVNIDILAVRELRWIRMEEFNSENHDIYYCRQESLRINGVALIVNKSLKCSTWVQSQKQQKDLSSFPGQMIQSKSMPQTLMLKKLKLNGSVEDLHDILELTPKKMFFLSWGTGI